MSTSKPLAYAGILVLLAVLLQLVPVILTEAFILVTMLSALPIYILARTNINYGILGFLTAVILISLFNTHEGVIFLLANGPVGLGLGICSHYVKKDTNTAVIIGSILAVTLIILNYGIGIPVFGGPIPGSIVFQVIILWVFSVLYSRIYLYAADYIHKTLGRFCSI